MCNFNIMCQVRDGSCLCGHQNFLPNIFRPIAVPSYPTQDTTVLSTLFKILQQQNEMIKTISEQTKTVLDRIITISDNPQPASTSNEEIITVSHIQEILCGTEIDHKYRLELITELPNPAYKERAFSIMLQIFDRQGKKVVLKESFNFKILLFTTETPPKVMKLNTAGDKVLKGCVEAQGNSTVFFRKVAVKEVTSHFRNGCFFFVVSTKDTKEIRPLIVEGFVVKARKMNNEPSLRKLQKTENESFTTDD